MAGAAGVSHAGLQRQACMFFRNAVVRNPELRAAALALSEKPAQAVMGTVEVLTYLGLPLVRGDAWTSPALLAEAAQRAPGVRAEGAGLSERIDVPAPLLHLYGDVTRAWNGGV